MNPTPIYLDNHATTRVDPRVVEAMLPYFGERFGNPGSVSHAYGWDAKDAVDAARQQVATALNASPREIVFTSGATESNNLAIRGLAERAKPSGRHLVSVLTEHHAVLDPLERLEPRGFSVSLARVEPAGGPRAGIVDVDHLCSLIRDDTRLVAVMLANNEVGAIQPIDEIGRFCRARGVPLLCDATQALGKLPIDVRALHVDLLSFSAHKLHGPKGIGGLYVRRGAGAPRLQPQIDGGGQEAGLRSGTTNVPGVVGLAKALELALAEQPGEGERLRSLRDRLYEGLLDRVPALVLNGPRLDEPGLRLPGNLNVSVPRVDGEALLNVQELAVSSGSACTSANPRPSHVLRAMGLDDDLARASLRFGLGRFNTPDDIERAIERVVLEVARLRTLGSVAP